MGAMPQTSRDIYPQPSLKKRIMKDESAIIWINVSTSANWKRPVVGIVRVEVEVKAQLQKLYPQNIVKECSWFEGRFVEHKAKQTSPKLQDAPKAIENPPHQELGLLYPILPRRKAIKAIAQGLLSILPSILQPIFSQILIFFKYKISHILASQAYRKLKVSTSQIHRVQPLTTTDKSSKEQASPFKAGDVLISVGLDWEYPYLPEFSRLKEQEAVKIVTCCYDLIPILFPQYCASDVASRFTQYFIDLANSSDLILCISKQSERDLKHFLNQTGASLVATHVFPLGDNVPEVKEPVLSDEIAAILNAPFILFVSTIERRKNHQVLYQAYHILCQQGKQAQLPKLIFVGMSGWGVDDLLKDIALDPLTQGLIIQCNHVTDAELRHLYAAALCCVFPSLYEGWGLPVGEALALGKIVLSSDRGSLPEVGGDLVTYIDPWNATEWAAQIWRVSSDERYQKAQEERVKATYQAHGWREAAQSIKTAIDKLIAQPFSMTTLYPGYDLSSLIGEHVGPVIRSKGKAGTLLTGPNKAMPAGKYQLTLWDDASFRQKGYYTISILAEQQLIVEHVNQDIQSTEKSGMPLITIDFKLDQAIRSLNIQCQLISGELSIEKIEIKAL